MYKMNYKDRLVKRLTENLPGYIILLIILWFLCWLAIILVVAYKTKGKRKLPFWIEAILSTIGAIVLTVIFTALNNLNPLPCIPDCTVTSPICSDGECVKCDANNKCPKEATCNTDGSCSLVT